MRLFWKIVLMVAVPIGGYWLYKKGNTSSLADTETPSGQPKETQTAGSDARRASAELSDNQIIEQLSEVDGVTSRVARNLVEKGIKSKEALVKLSEEELRSVKGIGPKRAAKILNL